MPVSQVSEISMRTPVTSLRSDYSLGKRPTTRVRFLIWLLTFSQALDVRRRLPWASEFLEPVVQVESESARFVKSHDFVWEPLLLHHEQEAFVVGHLLAQLRNRAVYPT